MNISTMIVGGYSVNIKQHKYSGGTHSGISIKQHRTTYGALRRNAHRYLYILR